MVRLLDKVPGIGKLIASVIAASVPTRAVFKSGRDFAAWLGLTPRQNSSGGKQTLGGITQQGNPIHKEAAGLWGRPRCSTSWASAKAPCATGLSGCLAKKPARLVTVALANKLARILWAMMNHRRMLPHRDVCEGVRKRARRGKERYRRDIQVRVWQAQRDVMNDTRRHRRQEQPAKCTSAKLAALIWIPVVGLHQGPRTYVLHRQAGHMTAADQIVQTSKKCLPSGPFSNRVSLVNGFVAAPGHGSLPRSE